MRSILGLLTVVSVVIITLLFIAFGSRSGNLEKDVAARVEKVKNTEEFQSAMKTIEELRAKMSLRLNQLSLAMADLSKDMKKQADPEIAKVTEQADEVVGKLDGELKGLNQDLDKSSVTLKEKFAKLTEEGRKKAVEAYQWLEDQIDKLETSIALTMMALRSAFKKGAEEFEVQKAKLEEHLKKVGELKKGLNPESKPLE
jgi:hypothetical protein